jgi:hypothetical protein
MIAGLALPAWRTSNAAYALGGDSCCMSRWPPHLRLVKVLLNKLCVMLRIWQAWTHVVVSLRLLTLSLQQHEHTNIVGAITAAALLTLCCEDEGACLKPLPLCSRSASQPARCAYNHAQQLLLGHQPCR